MKFLGYVRPDGSTGIRNHTLVMANGRGAATLAAMVSKLVSGTRLFIQPNENGRDGDDRKTIARTMIGLAKNANVGAVLIVGNKPDAGYPEFSYDAFVGEIAKSGKPMETVFMKDCGGFQDALGLAVRKCRNLVQKASETPRTEVDFGALNMAVKCGYSDATSGMSGNPVVGHLFDTLVDNGGRAMFAETTEVIGAEHIVAKRFTDEGERDKFLRAVERVEEEARSTGEDIRTINPIPANIQAGLTTLEEKSLGAIVKSGTRPIQGCTQYGEIPEGRGLYYMDSWMSSTALFLGFAAAGSVLNIFQVGGGWFPDDAMMPTVNTGLITPTLYMTGNPRTWDKGWREMDFNSGTVITEKEPIADAGGRLVDEVLAFASGRLTKGETLDIRDNVEVYLRGPGL
ncbi:D-galactarate dehydratase [Pseudodesulfovibrio cashew]|uniref:D-galactarate dehydratase n=1 Tax=Pseudodesulfovibrio cashew TaxID=2678688 RepID=A0A6I6JKX3_9BACT|nr:UxaA family hydrolase [Pseudodesulfovibrio cashew]QGY41839.1 D-galactarate dehydratase [Pseudodesulfovibrio cashew]